jgi:hypothetical protein
MSPIRAHLTGVIPFLERTGADCRRYLLIRSARVLNPERAGSLPTGASSREKGNVRLPPVKDD